MCGMSLSELKKLKKQLKGKQHPSGVSAFEAYVFAELVKSGNLSIQGPRQTGFATREGWEALVFASGTKAQTEAGRHKAARALIIRVLKSCLTYLTEVLTVDDNGGD